MTPINLVKYLNMIILSLISLVLLGTEGLVSAAAALPHSSQYRGCAGPAGFDTFSVTLGSLIAPFLNIVNK